MCTKCRKCGLNSTQSREILESKIDREPAGTMHGLGWDVEEVLHKCNIWSRSYSCPSQVPAAPVPGVSCLTNICGLCHPVSQTVVSSGLGAGLSGHDWEVQCWMDRWSRTLPRKFPKFHMGHINSPPLNIMITFLNTHLVRKGVGWHYINFSFPSASACQFPFQFSSPLSFFSVTPWVPRASPSSSFTSALHTENSAKERPLSPHCPHPWHLLCPSVAFLGQEGLCRSVFAQHQVLQGSIHHRSSQPPWSPACSCCCWSLYWRSFFWFLFMRAVSVAVGWSKCHYHSIILILQHLVHVALTW